MFPQEFSYLSQQALLCLRKFWFVECDFKHVVLGGVCGFACSVHSKHALLCFQGWLLLFPRAAYAVELYLKKHVVKSSKSLASSIGKYFEY